MPQTPALMGQIVADTVIDAAYAWLGDRRRDYSANDDVWTVRQRWPRLKPQLQAELRAGSYRFSPVRRYRTPEGARDVWAAPDALVLKAMALVRGRHLKSHLSPHCTHLAGHGGSKAGDPKGGGRRQPGREYLCPAHRC